MKKSLTLVLVLGCLLLAACGAKAPEAPEPAAEPAVSPTAAAETMAAPPATPEPTPEPTAAPRFTAGEETAYVLCEGKGDGAKALSGWLRSAGTDIAGSFVPDGLDAPMYTVLVPERFDGELPAAADETRRLRVAADQELLESGLLGALLPAFEKATGYLVEVYAGDVSLLTAEAVGGEADVLLMKKNDAAAIGGMAHYPARYDFVSTIYLLS